MVGDISLATRTEVLCAIRNRYAGASKMDKTKMLDEFVAMVGCHRKHAVRLLGQSDVPVERKVPMGQRIYDEAVRQALILVWEAADRICGKRLKAALPSMVESLERPRSSRPRPRCARAAVVGERIHHRPATETGEGEGGKPQEAQEEEEDGEPGSGTHLRGLERTRARVSRDRPGGPWRRSRVRSLHPQPRGD